VIDLYFAPTPNGWKVTIMLEECGLPYQLIPLNISAGEQFEDDFLAISPNARMPAIVDQKGAEGPIRLFESAAILMYLAEKSEQFMPQDQGGYYSVIQWLFWQMANLGPMAGQVSHFINYAPDGNEYSKQRYLQEYDRLLGVMNFQLGKTTYLAGEDYTIADMASYPWLLPYKRYGFDLTEFSHLKRWFDELKQRPALRRGIEVGQDWRPEGGPDEKTRAILFNQTSAIYKDR
jgi:GST-like protein